MPIALPVIAVIATVVAGASYFLSRPERIDRIIRRIKGARTAVPSHIEQGATVRMVGKVAAFERTLVAPVSGRACVAFDVRARAASPGKSSAVVLREAIPFLVETVNGSILVLPGSGEGLALDEDAWRQSVSDLPDELVAKISAEKNLGGLRPTELIGAAEGALVEGETVTVVGRARLEAGEGGAYRAYIEQGRRLVLVGTPSDPVLVTDLSEVRV